MPFCRVGDYTEQDVYVHNGMPAGVELFYQLYGYGDTKVLLIAGVAATHEAWGPQLPDLCGTDIPNQEEARLRSGYGEADVGQKVEGSAHGESKRNGDGQKAGFSGGNEIQVCAFDNRGVGRSSAPRRKHVYTTTIMAKDALTLMDHLGWEKFHVVGHSMGGMIACKLAAIATNRVASLSVISTTGGGYECLPKMDRAMITIAYRFMRAKTPEERAHVDLDTHYTKDYLDTLVDGEYRRAVLYKEYVKNVSSSGMQPKHGLDGQFNACWTHRVTPSELDNIRESGIRVAVIHGRGDIVAQIRHAQHLARKLHPVARMVELPGGHMVTHQNTKEVNKALLDVIKAEEPYINSSECSDEGPYEKRWQIWQRSDGGDSRAAGGQLDCGCVGAVVEMVNKLWPQGLSFLYVFPTFYWPLSWVCEYVQAS